MPEAFLVGGVRTPLGKYGGALAGVRPDDLAALVVGAAVRRAGVSADAVDEVVLGAANQAGEDNRNVARMAVLLGGLPGTIPAYTVNRLCASGLTAIVSAAQAYDFVKSFLLQLAFPPLAKFQHIPEVLQPLQEGILAAELIYPGHGGMQAQFTCDALCKANDFRSGIFVRNCIE